MALMLDTEGRPIPSDCHSGRQLFDADLCDWGNGSGPELTVNVPRYFRALHGVYDSEGIVFVPLRDVLEQYLRDFTTEDGGENIEAFAAWLHDYADRLVAKKTASA